MTVKSYLSIFEITRKVVKKVQKVLKETKATELMILKINQRLLKKAKAVIQPGIMHGSLKTLKMQVREFVIYAFKVLHPFSQIKQNENLDCFS